MVRMSTELRAVASAPWIVQRSRSKFSSGPHSMPRAVIGPQEVNAGNHLSPGEHLLSGELPVGGKNLSKVRDYWTLQAKVEVEAAFAESLGPPPVVGGDIDAAGETHAPVGDEDFPMVAQVDVVKTWRYQRRVKHSHPHACAAQRLQPPPRMPSLSGCARSECSPSTSSLS